MKKNEELKPCPFCGEEKILARTQEVEIDGEKCVRGEVICTFCLGRMYAPTLEDAVKYWNMRADDEIKPYQLANPTRRKI